MAARVTAALAFTMGLDDPEARFDELDPKQVRDEIGAAWRDFFAALARDAPVLALIEDIHWADPALLDLLEQLAEWIDAPVLFLCPARPELLGGRPTWGGGKRNYSAIALDPLTADESEDLIRALLDIDDLPSDVHRRILERAGGNPFFLEEIVRQLVDGGHVVLDGERWRATGDVETVEIPDTVQAVLAARIDLLEPASRSALQAAAVVGRTFWPGAVARLLNGDGPGSRRRSRHCWRAISSDVGPAPPSPARPSTSSSTCSPATSPTRPSPRRPCRRTCRRRGLARGDRGGTARRVRRTAGPPHR